MKDLIIILFIFLFLDPTSYIKAQEHNLKKLKLKTVENEHKRIYHIRDISDSDEKILEGSYESWYKRVKVAEGNYENNLRTGKWYFYSYLGDLNYQGSYEEGKMTGLWEYELHGKKSAEVYFRNDIMDSAFGYYPNGKKSYEVKYFEDQSGICISYYENGQIHEYIPLKEKKIHGRAVIFFYNGLVHKQLIYDRSMLEKIVSCYDFNGNIIYGGNLENGEGEYVQYYLPYKEDDDSLRIYSLEHYEDYFLNGEASYLQRNGLPLSKGDYENGIKKGVWENYDENGIKQFNESHIKSPFNISLNVSEDHFPYIIDNSLSRTIVTKFQGLKIPEYSFVFDEQDTIYREDFRKKCNWFIKRNRRYFGGLIYPGTVTFWHNVYISVEIGQDGEINIIDWNNEVETIVDEGKRLLNIMPHWSPAFYLGVPVPLKSTFLFPFILQHSLK